MSIPADVDDRKNWPVEAFTFDAVVALAVLAVAVRAWRTRLDAEVVVASDASCRARCVVGSRIGAACLMVLAPIVALVSDYSSWSVHLADQAILVVLGIVHAICATTVALRRRGEGAAARWLWSLALIVMLPRLTSSETLGTDEERASAWILAVSVICYVCATLTPPSGLPSSHVRGWGQGERRGTFDGDSWKPSRAATAGTTARLEPQDDDEEEDVQVDASLARRSAGPAVALLGGTDGRQRRKSGGLGQARSGGTAVRFAGYGTGPLHGSVHAGAVAATYSGGWEAADARLWAAANPFAEGTPPVLGLQGLRFLTALTRAVGLLLVGAKLDELLTGAGDEAPLADWTVLQSSLVLLLSLFLPLPAAMAACLSAPREDPTGAARLLQLSSGWLASLVAGGAGPGGVATVVLWALHADGRADFGPWLIAAPLAAQALVCSILLLIAAVAVAVTESRAAWQVVLLAALCAGVLTAAVLLPVLPAAKLEPLGRSNASDGGDALSWTAVGAPAYVLAMVCALVFAAVGQWTDAGVGAWRPQLSETVAAIGYGISALLFALSLDLGAELPSEEHPSGVLPADALSPLVIAFPAVAGACLCAAVDGGVLLLQGLAACKVLEVEEVDDAALQEAVASAPRSGSGVGVALTIVEHQQGPIARGCCSACRSGWGPVLMLDDTLMAGMAVDFEAAAAGRGGEEAIAASRRRRQVSSNSSSPRRRRRSRRDTGGGDDDLQADEHQDARNDDDPEHARRAAGVGNGVGGGGAAAVTPGGLRSGSSSATSDPRVTKKTPSRQPLPADAGLRTPAAAAAAASAAGAVPSASSSSAAMARSEEAGDDEARAQAHARAMAARRRVLGLRKRGLPMTMWDQGDVAAWLEAVVGWRRLADAAVANLAASAGRGEEVGSVLMRLWLRGRSAGARWTDLEDTVGQGSGGTERLVKCIVGEAGSLTASKVAKVKRKRQRALQRQQQQQQQQQQDDDDDGGVDSAASSQQGNNNDDDDDDDEASRGLSAGTSEDELGLAAADDDGLERVLRLARAAARKHEGGAVAAAKAEARAWQEQQLARMPRDWPATVWLPQLGLPQLAPLFASVTPERLANMRRERDFAALGVHSPAHRRSLLAGVRFLRLHHFDLKGQIADLRREKWRPRPVLPDHLPAWTNREVVAWLRDSLPLDAERHARQVDKLRHSGLHGALLFSSPPFSADDVIAGFGLTRATARGALVARIEDELALLEASGASAATAAKGSYRRRRRRSDTAAGRRQQTGRNDDDDDDDDDEEGGGGGYAQRGVSTPRRSTGGRRQGDEDGWASDGRASSVETGDSGNMAGSAGGTRSSFRRESVASAGAFEAAFSREALSEEIVRQSIAAVSPIASNSASPSAAAAASSSSSSAAAADDDDAEHAV